MGGRIDAVGRPGDHGQALAGQFAGQHGGHPPAVVAGGAGTDDRHRRLAEAVQVAPAGEYGTVGNGAEGAERRDRCRRPGRYRRGMSRSISRCARCRAASSWPRSKLGRPGRSRRPEPPVSCPSASTGPPASSTSRPMSTQPRPGKKDRVSQSSAWAQSVKVSLFPDERLQILASRRVAELLERLRLDLPDPFPGHGEALAHFLQGVVAADLDAVAHAQHLFLARGE